MNQCRVALRLVGAEAQGSGAPVCGLLPVTAVAAWPLLSGDSRLSDDGSLCVTRKLLGSRAQKLLPRVESGEISVPHPSHAQRSVTGVVHARAQ